LSREREEKFTKLISEARTWKMSGWDFSTLGDRLIEESPPWDFRKIAKNKIAEAKSLLDLGTGGGEFLSSLAPLPKDTYCTEGFPPNVPIAKRNLSKLGVQIIRADQSDNTCREQIGAIPLQAESIDLIIDRHESFMAEEVHRVLKNGGTFLTQQVGSQNLLELNDLLGGPKPTEVWDLVKCEDQIRKSGLKIIDSKEAKIESFFKDIGAVVCYLLSAP
jgi:SAM-dependent methyltransferase